MDEIEIEIDALPPKVLHALWNVVIKPKSAPAPAPAASKSAKNGRHAGTGGLKRKSMDEEAEARKMREIDARINMFSNGTSGGSPTANGTNGVPNGADARRTSAATTTTVGRGDVDSVHSSDSESDSGSDSSDSD
jgi:bromodomain-containing factor 1